MLTNKVKFVKRIAKPSIDNPLFVMKKYGGKSPCIQGKPLIKEGYVLPNCVGYAYGRFWEIGGVEIKVGTAKGLDYPQSAQYWFTSNDGLERGKEPRLGAIACWNQADMKLGHIGVVEEIKPNSIVVSESLYGYDVPFRLREITKPYNYGKEIFRGFIYHPLIEKEDKPSEIDLKVGDNVKICDYGNASSYGNGWRANGIGWIRHIMKIWDGREYPYQVGANGITTGFYKKEALKKV